jgi:hypothetical protein
MATSFEPADFSRRPLPPMAPVGSGRSVQPFDVSVRRAIAATRAAGLPERDARRCICRFLCQIAAEPAFDFTAPLPLTRADVAAALGISLVRVKRALALLSLTGVVTEENGALRVLDWPRLCSAAAFAPAALGFSFDEAAVDAADDAGSTPFFGTEGSDAEAHLITAAGDQAYFG